MNNKLLKVFLILSFIFVCQMLFSACYASGDSVYEILIEDDANLLTDSQEDELRKDMEPLVKYGNIIFKSNDSRTTSTAGFVREYYHNRFGTSSGTVFYIDMYHREIYIFSDGYNYSVITKGKALSITDNVYKNASNGDYYKCASEAFSQMFILLSANDTENNVLVRLIAYLKFQEPMKIICNAIFAILISSFFWFIIIFSKYRIKGKKDKEIISKSKHFIEIKNVEAYLSNVRKVYNPRSDSSSSGSSGGHSSGGGGHSSSGGGGGHRF